MFYFCLLFLVSKAVIFAKSELYNCSISWESIVISTFLKYVFFIFLFPLVEIDGYTFVFFIILIVSYPSLLTFSSLLEASILTVLFSNSLHFFHDFK